MERPENDRSGGPREVSPLRPSESVTGDAPQVGWHGDPFGRFAQRWWTGSAWSERVVTAHGTQALDPPILVVAPFAGLEELQAKPLNEDVSMPLSAPSAAPQVTWWLGLIVFIGLLALIVMAAVALS